MATAPYVPSTSAGGPGGIAVASSGLAVNPNVFNENDRRAQRNTVNQLANQAAIIGNIIAFPQNAITQPTNVTGVTLTTQGVALADQPSSANYTLAYTASSKTMTFGGGTGVVVSAGGLFTLTSSGGKSIKAYVVVDSLPGTNQSDTDIHVGQNITGVTLSVDAIAPASRPRSGSRALTFVASGTLLSFDGGLAQDVHVDGTYTLTAADGTQVTAVVVGASLPSADATDAIQIYQGMGLNGYEIFTVVVGTKEQFLLGTQFESLDATANSLTQPVNTTGVVLSFDGVAAGSRLTEGKHTFTYVDSTTTLSVDGATGTDIGAGGTFTITAPNGKTVKAIVTAASLPGADKSDTIYVGSFVKTAKTRLDPTPRQSIMQDYRQL